MVPLRMEVYQVLRAYEVPQDLADFITGELGIGSYEILEHMGCSMKNHEEFLKDLRKTCDPNVADRLNKILEGEWAAKVKGFLTV